jgi:hypothetical protein
MADNFLAGTPLPNISSTTTTDTTGPSWYNSTLQNIANAGNTAMGYNADGTPIKGFTPSSMIAAQDPLTTGAVAGAKTVADSYKTGLTNAESTAGKTASGIGSEDINKFLNPYTQDVVSNLANQTYQNVNSNLIPSIMAMGAGSGQAGSQRMYNAGANAISNVQSGLIGEQSKALQSGYNTALDAALKQANLYNEAAKTQSALAGQEQGLGMAGGNYENALGNQQQAYKQSIINQPQTAAANAASALASLKVPSTVTAGYVGPGQSGQYSTSPLGAVTGLASLFAAGNNGTSPAKGITDLFGGLFSGSNTGTNQNIIDWLGYDPAKH